jgi:hypothetical protein
MSVKPLILWAVQKRYGARDEWEWAADVHGQVEAWRTRESAMQVSHREAAYLGSRNTRVVRMSTPPQAAESKGEK